MKRRGKYDKYFDEISNTRNSWSKDSKDFYKYKKKKMEFLDEWLKRPKFKEKIWKDFRYEPT
jgi:hypothetical protein